MLLPLYNDFRADPSELTSPEQRMRLEGILDCREARRVDVCSACPVYDECSLVKSYLRDFGGSLGASSRGGTR